MIRCCDCDKQINCRGADEHDEVQCADCAERSEAPPSYQFHWPSKTYHLDGLKYRDSVWQTDRGWTCGNDVYAADWKTAIEFYQVHHVGETRPVWWIDDPPPLDNGRDRLDLKASGARAVSHRIGSLADLLREKGCDCHEFSGKAEEIDECDMLVVGGGIDDPDTLRAVTQARKAGKAIVFVPEH